MRTLTLSLIGATAIAVSFSALVAQRSNSGRPGKGAGPRTARAASRPGDMGPGGGFFLIPPFVAERMKLTDEQRKQLDDLTKETKAKLDAILTPEQQKMLREARPPRPDRGPGGPDGDPGMGPDDGGPGEPDGPPPAE